MTHVHVHVRVVCVHETMYWAFRFIHSLRTLAMVDKGLIKHTTTFFYLKILLVLRYMYVYTCTFHLYTCIHVHCTCSCRAAADTINGATIQGLTRRHDRQQWQPVHNRAEICEWIVDVGCCWHHLFCSWSVMLYIFCVTYTQCTCTCTCTCKAGTFAPLITW